MKEQGQLQVGVYPSPVIRTAESFSDVGLSATFEGLLEMPEFSRMKQQMDQPAYDGLAAQKSAFLDAWQKAEDGHRSLSSAFEHAQFLSAHGEESHEKLSANRLAETKQSMALEQMVQAMNQLHEGMFPDYKAQHEGKEPFELRVAMVAKLHSPTTSQAARQ
jgi:uncharacterized protein with von Willebrand factor type A (vWA) domain